MEIITNIENNYEFEDIIKLFEPSNYNELNLKVEHVFSENESCYINEYTLILNNCEYKHNKKVLKPSVISSKNLAKIGLYEILSKIYNKTLPYGALTGIRPVKLCYDLMAKGIKKYELKKFLMENYYVSNEKSDLIIETLINQGELDLNDKLINFYVNIPFCPTRCSYCSFISTDKNSTTDEIIDEYVDKLVYEINETKKFLFENYYIVKNVYIGGGTPTTLNEKQLEKVLQALSFNVKEFTVEAGRPDTITKEKLDLFQKYHVTRISINPQTLNDKVLEKIGRHHTAKDALNAYTLARKYNFDINMDLIMGLPTDTLKGFKETLDAVIYLNPENITIHTLSLKRNSNLSNEKANIFKNESIVNKMSIYSYTQLKQNNYTPYYLYRQKNMINSLENLGYSHYFKQCNFNIETMDDLASVVACGANAISKRVFSLKNRIERAPNVKDIKEYNARIVEMINRKKELFKN